MHSTTSKDRFNRIKGGIYGALVGDALGVPVEFKTRYSLEVNPVTGMQGYGTHNQPPGTWSDDGAMILCTMEALTGNYSLEVLAGSFVRWVADAHWTARGSVFDVGVTTKESIQRLACGKTPTLAGGDKPYNNGNGSLMRILPYALHYNDDETIATQAMLASSLTHRHPRSCLACAVYCVLASQLLKGQQIRDGIAHASTFINQWDGSPSSELIDFKRCLSPDFGDVASYDLESDGYVIHTLEASIWCMLKCNDFKTSVLRAVNLGDDADTTGCVTGGLAGLLYGFDSIPIEWIEAIPRRTEIDRLITAFYAHSPTYTG